MDTKNPLEDPRIVDFLHQRSYDYKSQKPLRTRRARQITITSPSGAGKSSLMELLQLDFPGFEFRSGGGWFREKARQQGFGDDIGAFARYNREHPELGFDLECDAYLHQASYLFPDNLIQESRFSHCAVPNAYHVLLTCPLEIRAGRRHADLVERHPDLKVEEVMEKLRQRDDDDEARLRKLYPQYLWPEFMFDLVIPTDKVGKREMALKVVTGFWQWHAAKPYTDQSAVLVTANRSSPALQLSNR